MAEGFRVRNAANILQIDGLYQNLELLIKATLTLSNVDALGYYNDITIPANKPGALLAIRDTGSGCYVQVSNPGTFRVYTDRVTGSANKVIEYFLFAEPVPTTISGGVGFVVRHPTTAQVIFHSARRYFRVLGIALGVIPIDTSTSQAFPGRKMAIMQCMRPHYFRVETGGTPQQPIFVITIYSGMMRIDSNGNPVVDNKAVTALTGVGGAIPGVSDVNNASYMYIDVTGF